MLKGKLITIFLCLLIACNIFASNIILSKPQNPNVYSYSGDNQTKTIGELSQPIRVMVTDNEGNPIREHELVFTCISYPKGSKDYKIDKKFVCTDSTGLAENYFLVGDKEGTYEILVSSNENHDAEQLVYKVNARKSTWVILLIIGLLGGLALFLYGMDSLSKGMQAAAGNKMRSIISKVTKNRFFGLFAGLFVTVLIQSSSATSVMLVGFVEAGLMGFAQTLAMLLGAGIGTTVTAQLIAFKLTDYSLLIVAIGFTLIAFPKKQQIKSRTKVMEKTLKTLITNFFDKFSKNINGT
jgi:hypothetical protein